MFSKPELHTTRAVLRLLKDELNINLNHKDIIAAQSLPRKQLIDNRPAPSAPSFVKFVHYSDEHSLICSRKKLKHADILIFEDLTGKNQLLLNRLNNDERVLNAWFFKGVGVEYLKNFPQINTRHVALVTYLLKNSFNLIYSMYQISLHKIKLIKSVLYFLLNYIFWKNTLTYVKILTFNTQIYICDGK